MCRRPRVWGVGGLRGRCVFASRKCLAMGDFSRHLPHGYHWMVERGLVGFDPLTQLQPWYFLRENDLFDVAERWPDGPCSRDGLGPLIAFARRQDCDDIACCRPSGRIVVVHGWTGDASGYSADAEYADFAAWMKSVVDDIAEWL